MSVPWLTYSKVAEWLEAHGWAEIPQCTDRQLRGCIVIHQGIPVIFLDPNDGENEQRFTIAHELAHFALDYEIPRRHAISIFGESICEVLDGVRSPTSNERLSGMLTDVPLGTYLNYLERDMDGRLRDIPIQEIELAADELALHLLSPSHAILELVGTPSEMNCEVFTKETERVLVSRFGLPTRIASGYARTLFSKWSVPDSKFWLGLS